MTRATLAVAFLASALFGGYLQKISDAWPMILASWKKRQKPAPIAKVISRSGDMVPVYEKAHTFSPVICWLIPGELIALDSPGTKHMKTVAVEFNEQGVLIKNGWVNRRHLKRITLQRSYAIKRVAEQSGNGGK